MKEERKLERLLNLFSHLFGTKENTVLMLGQNDPLYLPQEVTGKKSEIYFAHGFFSSALHEIAHWLIAGKDRRSKIDYGYWYQPDGRTPDEQERFEAFESHNQGLEWILSSASDHDFHVSADNLSGSTHDGRKFAARVRSNALNFLENGFNLRSRIMIDALIAEFSDRSSFDRYWQSVVEHEILPPHVGSDFSHPKGMETRL